MALELISDCDMICSTVYFTEKAGFVTISYNKRRNIIAWLLTQVCNDIGAESMLQALTGEKLTGCSDCVVEDKNVDKCASFLSKKPIAIFSYMGS